MADESRSSNTSDSDSGSEPELKQPARTTETTGNVFKNDGSFMEMFKKMQDERAQKDSSYFGNPSSTATSKTTESEDTTETAVNEESTSQPIKKPSVLSLVGKRRGGRVLPTGIVKKPKKPEDPNEDGEQNDAWSRYLSEVRKYREQSCEEEGKRRPLVK